MSALFFKKFLLASVLVSICGFEAIADSPGGCSDCPASDNYQSVMLKLTNELMELDVAEDGNIYYATAVNSEEQAKLVKAGFSFSAFSEELNKGSSVQIYRVISSLKPTTEYIYIVLPPPGSISDPLAVIPGLGARNTYGADEVIILGHSGEAANANVSRINVIVGSYGIMSNEFLKVYSTDVKTVFPYLKEFFDNGLEFDVGNNKFAFELLKHAIIASAKK